MGSPSQASPGRGQRRGDRAMTMKKWLRKRLVRAALGCGEKRRGAAGGRGSAVEDGKADATLTRVR
jgi:hypothetical protein